MSHLSSATYGAAVPRLAAEHLLQLFDQAPSFMAVIHGPDHVFEMANGAYLKLVGHRDILGKTVREALPEVLGQGFFELLDTVYATREPFVGRGFRIELQQEPNGSLETRYLNFVYQPIVDEHGAVYGIFAEGSDVSELFEAQGALAGKIATLERLEKRQALHLEMADALRSISCEEDIGAVAARLLGREVGSQSVALVEIDEDLGIFAARVFGGQAHPSGEIRRGPLAEFDVFANGLLSGGAPFITSAGLSVPSLDVTIRRFLSVDEAASMLVIPFANGGRATRFIALARPCEAPWETEDIDLVRAMAERVWSSLETCRAQSALKAERDESRHIFLNMTEGFAIISADWHMKQINALGLKVGQREAQLVVGRSLWDVWPEIIGTEVETRYRRVMGSRSAETFEELVAFSNGKNVWLELRLLPMPDGGMAVLYQDIGDRKKILQGLQDADRRKDEFLAMLAHELRNPLAPIVAAAQMLAVVPVDVDNGARVRHLGQVVARQANHMTSLVSDLLDVSRVTSGLVKLESERLDIRQVVEESIEQVMPFVEAKRHKLTLLSSVRSALVMGDRKRLVQIVTNLLQNSAKYTPDGGKISVGIQADGARIEVCIRDNGTGMDAELLPFVFDLFTQERRSSDRAQGGLGLGLALVKSLAALHGGEVLAHSDGLGRGSTFTVSLPLLTALPQDPLSDTRSLSVLPKPLKLLVVDDNIDAADLLAMFLETSGHQVVVQYSSADALHTAEAEKYDVFLLDIGLPDMDGNELARRLRASSQSAHATIIAVTGYGQEYDKDTSIAAGFDYYFVKPANPKLLVELLAGISPA